MAKKSFDMGEFAKTLNQAIVSDSDTIREQLEYLDIDLLDDDPANFYELSGLEELAANIQLCGLQQPLRVRPGENGRFTIVSGHRRRAAVRLLLDAGQTQERTVPCIREQASGSQALQELRLIFANSDTRKLTSHEQSQQAERVEKLLYALQGEGYEFPGRMRDQVAAACQMSATKLANLKIIREGLSADFQKLYKKGDLKESAALVLAHLSPEHQEKCHQYCKEKKEPKYFYESDAKRFGEFLQGLDRLHCKQDKGQRCSNKEKKWAKYTAASYSYAPCATTCCGKCSQLASCKYACPKMAEQVKLLKADSREANRRDKEEKAEKERPDVERITAIWARFAEARAAARKSVKEVYTALNRYYGNTAEADWVKKERGEKVNPSVTLPFGYNFYLGDAKNLSAAAELLGCSVDFLLCRTDEPGRGAESCAPNVVTPAWRTDSDYPRGGWVTCLFDLAGNGHLVRKVLHADYAGRLEFGTGINCDMAPVAWLPLPEIPEELYPARGEDDCDAGAENG